MKGLDALLRALERLDNEICALKATRSQPLIKSARFIQNGRINGMETARRIITDCISMEQAKGAGE